MACSHTIAPTNGCDWVGEITVSHDDALTDETAAEIISHNELWMEICEHG